MRPSRAEGLRRTLGAVALVALAGCSALPAPLPNRDLWLLGEVHDNAEGHAARYRLIAQRVEAGWRPAIVMEQFDRERQGALDAALRECREPMCIVERAGGRGWDWEAHQPLLALALRHRLPVVAANVSRDDARRIAREGFAAGFDAATVAAYGLDRPLPGDIAATQAREIVDGHCGQLPASAATALVRAQVARDVEMARALTANAGRGAVLIAGNGHVRKDVGVPRWLPPGASALSVGFLEAGGGDPGVYDATRAIPRHEREDPCAGLTMPAAPAS